MKPIDQSILNNISGFSRVLTDRVRDSEAAITGVRLAVTSKADIGQISMMQVDGILVVSCNPSDRYTLGCACMSVFRQVPAEYQSRRVQREEEMVTFMKRQTVALEDLVKIVRAK
jgi:hypothetical protein